MTNGGEPGDLPMKGRNGMDNQKMHYILYSVEYGKPERRDWYLTVS
jgi:hypothetical protein